jgi:hypothetical protein
MSLCLTVKHYAMKPFVGVDVYTHVFLALTLVGADGPAACPRANQDDTEK